MVRRAGRDFSSALQHGLDLVPHRLAAAGRHQHERVAAADQVADDDLFVLVAEALVAEHVV